MHDDVDSEYIRFILMMSREQSIAHVVFWAVNLLFIVIYEV